MGQIFSETPREESAQVLIGGSTFLRNIVKWLITKSHKASAVCKFPLFPCEHQHIIAFLGELSFVSKG